MPSRPIPRRSLLPERSFTDKRPSLTLRILGADVWVIGAGAAGITLGSQLSGTNRSVIVLESGGLDEKNVQNLYAGTSAREYFSLTTSRFRMLGGATYVWDGWCARLDEIDFRPRDWVPHSVSGNYAAY